MTFGESEGAWRGGVSLGVAAFGGRKPGARGISGRRPIVTGTVPPPESWTGPTMTHHARRGGPHAVPSGLCRSCHRQHADRPGLILVGTNAVCTRPTAAGTRATPTRTPYAAENVRPQRPFGPTHRTSRRSVRARARTEGQAEGNTRDLESGRTLVGAYGPNKKR